MGGYDLSSAVIQGAIRELRSLALMALARALGDSPGFSGDMRNLTAILTPVGAVPTSVLRRGSRVNNAMPFSVFEPGSPLQQRVLASGKDPGFLERLLTRFRREPAHVPSEWAQAALATALTAPAFLAEAQRLLYRGLRQRVFFAPDGPPLEPLSVQTFLTLIMRSGRPSGLSEQAWARLEAMVQQAPDQPGPTDRLVLAEARKTFGMSTADTMES
mgnify:CR=1 FL=1